MHNHRSTRVTDRHLAERQRCSRSWKKPFGWVGLPARTAPWREPANTYLWLGPETDGGSANWSTVTNWQDTTTSERVPVGGTINWSASTLKFNNTSSKPSIDDTIAQVATLNVETGYTGTITLNTDLTLDGGGSLMSKKATITGKALDIEGGVFNWGAGQMGDLTTPQSETVVGASGTLVLSAATGADADSLLLVNRTLHIADRADPVISDDEYQVQLTQGLLGLVGSASVMNEGSFVIDPVGGTASVGISGEQIGADNSPTKLAAGAAVTSSITTALGRTFKADLGIGQLVGIWKTGFNNNGGNVLVSNGGLSLAGGGTNSGQVTLANNATLSFASPSSDAFVGSTRYTWQIGTVFTGSGIVFAAGGNNSYPIISVAHSLTVTFDQNVGFQSYGAIIGGRGTIELTGGTHYLAGTWLSGTVQAGSIVGGVTLKVDTGASLLVGAYQLGAGLPTLLPAIHRGAQLVVAGGIVNFEGIYVRNLGTGGFGPTDTTTSYSVDMGPQSGITVSAGSLILASPVNFSYSNREKYTGNAQFVITGTGKLTKPANGGWSSIPFPIETSNNSNATPSIDVQGPIIGTNGITYGTTKYTPRAGGAGLFLDGPATTAVASLTIPAGSAGQSHQCRQAGLTAGD
jgi:hypothetical protein